MGSPNPTATRITVCSKNKNMSALDFVAPLAELAQNEKVQTKVVEAAKLFYSSGTITLNLVPAILSGSLLLLLLVPLLPSCYNPRQLVVSMASLSLTQSLTCITTPQSTDRMKDLMLRRKDIAP